MRLALNEARAAAYHDDVPVGAVLLDPSGATVAAAGNERERPKIPPRTPSCSSSAGLRKPSARGA